MEQGALTLIAAIRPGQATALRDLLIANPDCFRTMKTVHFAAFLILPGIEETPERLLLETNYDGNLEEHIIEMTTCQGQLLDRIYRLCEGYAPNEPSAAQPALRQYLKDHARPSSAFFNAFPGRSVEDIRNAIEVHQETQRYLDSRQRGQTAESAERTRDQVFAELVGHFGSRNFLMVQSVSERRLKWRRWLNLIPGALVAAAMGLVVLVLLPIVRLYEKREQACPAHDPTDHPKRHEGLDVGAQNHLCTLKAVKASRFRKFMTRWVLSLGKILAARIYVFGKLGSIATIHFARWILIDGGERVLFLSNFDGSWSAYLGDFSVDGWGNNLIWTNTEGHPPTRWMFWGGAYYLDAYEDVTLSHFHPALIFYSAYPGHSVSNIKRYLAFRDELAQAMKTRAKSIGRTAEMLDRSDIQGLVASGYGHLDHARFVFLSVSDCNPARAWLSRVAGVVTTAEHPGDSKSDTSFNIAFTRKGLEAMAPAGSLRGFSDEFVEGMNRPEAAMILGDAGDSAQEKWEFGDSRSESTDPVHILLLMYAKMPADLDRLGAEICPHPVKDGLRVIVTQGSERAPNDFTEPFGFRDGISQPDIIGFAHGPRSGIDNLIKNGEFLLGYENELGYRANVPDIVREQEADDLGQRSAFGRNGSYLVFRKLAQDVEGFEKFLEDNSRNTDSTIDPVRKELFAAKLMGRWRSGAPLVLAGGQDNPQLADYNDFLYADDPEGHACPIGSHIRRANPRDSLPFKPSESLRLSRHHRIVRRGRKYKEPATGSSGNESKWNQGLYFIALNADLRRQFEFIQQTWLNDSTFGGLDNDKDPIAGDNDSSGKFTVQAYPVDRQVHGLARFVTVKGGGYFFLPGIRGLKLLASFGHAAKPAHTVPSAAAEARSTAHA
jgi:Dyp-type peroxidase family